MITDWVRPLIEQLLADHYNITDITPAISVPEAEFGDASTNVSFQLASRLKKSPQVIAEEMCSKLTDINVVKATAINGYINITIMDKKLWELALERPAKSLQGKIIVAEYSDPNPFKVLHAGHLYTTITGDAVANLLELAGATVHRVNFGGDVGLHVGRAMWAIIKHLGDENPNGLDAVNPEERLEWLSERYVEGTEAYEQDEQAKQAIIDTNKRVYQIHETDDHDSAFAKTYWICRQWSYEGFDRLYERLGVQPFEKYYPESQTAPVGADTVREGLSQGIFEESDNAIVYRGEQDGLHTRVFLTSNGLPTYEAKDLGLIKRKWEDYHFDLSLIITGNDIIEYMKVVSAAIRHFYPDAAARSVHLTHGMIRLSSGAKMSSRKGNVLRATDVLNVATSANQQQSGKDQPEVVLAAIKYAFLKQRMGGDIVYDPEESVSLHGSSGPYLQYAHARACSIIAKNSAHTTLQQTGELEPGERRLLHKIVAYNVVINHAVSEMLPHGICTYLYELSQEFNRFYEGNKVIGSDREATRLGLVSIYADTLRSGLHVLGIAAPDRI